MKRSTLISTSVLLGALLALPALAQFTTTTLHSPTPIQEGEFGAAVAGIGDINGDGVPDMVVGATEEEKAYVFSGADGSQLLPALTGGFGFGIAVAGAGDVDNDGIPDIIVGASTATVAGLDAGRAYVFSGATGALLPTHALQPAFPAAAGKFGIAVAGVGDLDGDGHAEVAVGASGETAGSQSWAGRVYVFDGATGSAYFPSHLEAPVPQTFSGFGGAVASAGDVNHDGTPDIIVGASSETDGSPAKAGKAYVFSGATGTLLPTHTLHSSFPKFFGRFGIAVAGAGDLNGDGFAEVAVGAATEDVGSTTGAGRVYIFDGQTGAALTPHLTPPTTGSHEWFGSSVAGAGDVNNDGTPDILVGAPRYSSGTLTRTGQAYLFSGAGHGLLHTLASPTAQTDGRFGNAVAGAGDLNGDGKDDVIVGAFQENFGAVFHAGQAHIFTSVPSPASLIFAGLLNTPEGQALLNIDVFNNLVVSNIGLSKLDGLSIDVDDGAGAADSAITVLLDPLELGGFVNPAWLSWQGKGVIDGQPGVFGLAALEESPAQAGFDLSADFSGVGATTVQVRVFKAGLLQGVTSAPTGVVGHGNPCFLVTDRVEVSRLSVVGHVNPEYIVGFENLVEFTDLQNNTFVGDEIRLEPVSGVPPIDFSKSPFDEPVPMLREGFRGMSILGNRNDFASARRRNTPLAPLEGGIAATPTATPSHPLSHSPSLPRATATGIESFDSMTILAAGVPSFTVTNEALSVQPAWMDFVALANKQVKFDGAIASEGRVHSNGDILFQNDRQGTHSGNLSAVEDITVEKGVTIAGNAIAGGELRVSGTITGTQEEHAAVGAMPLPSFSFTAGGDDITVPKKGALALPPGTYGKVKVLKKGTLQLSAGDYFMDELDTEKKATLSADVSTGAVHLFVVQDLDLDDRVEVVLTPNGDSDSDLLSFVSLQEHKIDIGKKARVLGTLIAAKTEVHFSKGDAFRGSVSAEKITVEEGVPFLHHSSTTPLPKAGVEESAAEAVAAAVPEEYALLQNYPNPFNPRTVIHFQLPERSEVKLAIYNLRGQMVRELARGEFASGAHKIVWDATDAAGVRVASGVYVYRIVAGEFVEVRKMVLMK